MSRAGRHGYVLIGASLLIRDPGEDRTLDVTDAIRAATLGHEGGFVWEAQAGFTSFLVQDPSWVINPIVGENFAVADGVSTIYKVDVDLATSITTFTDGVQDSVQPVISLPLGIVIYASPPAGGSILSYSSSRGPIMVGAATARDEVADWMASGNPKAEPPEPAGGPG